MSEKIEAYDPPSETGREMAEEVRQSAPDFGVSKWPRDSDFSIHLAECFDVMYGMGRAALRDVALAEKAAPTACLSGIASNEPCRPDDTLKRCTICGFIVDTKYAAEPPNPERGPRK